MTNIYIKLGTLSGVVFLVGYIILNLEASYTQPGGYGGYFSLSYPLVLFSYYVFYGCFSYIKTKRVLLSNLLLLLISVAFWILNSPRMTADVIGEAVSISFMFCGVSFAFSLLTKLICWLKNRKSNNTEDC